MKVKMSASSNGDLDDDYLIELKCVLEVEALSKDFEESQNLNRNQNLNVTWKRPSADNVNQKQNSEHSQKQKPKLPPSSKRREHRSSKRAETPSADRLRTNTKMVDIPLDNISTGIGRGRLYSQEKASIKDESITQQVQNVLGDFHHDQRLMEMIREKSEQSRLAAQNRITFQQVLETLDKKLDKKAFIENWIYDCDKHLGDQIQIYSEPRKTERANIPKFREAERVAESEIQNKEHATNSQSLERERVTEFDFWKERRAAKYEETVRAAKPEPRVIEHADIPNSFRGIESAGKLGLEKHVHATNSQSLEVVAKPELRKTEHVANSDFTEMERVTKLEFQITECTSESATQITKCTDDAEPLIKECTSDSVCESGNAEIISNIKIENLLVDEPHRSLTDSSVIENARFGSENVSVKTEHSKYLNPNCEWRPLDPLAYEFNLSREFFPPLSASNSNSFNALNTSFSSSCFLPTTPHFIATPLMPYISSFSIPEPLETIERVLVVENLPKTILKSEVKEMFSIYGLIKEINIENTLHCCKVYLRADTAVLEWIKTLNGTFVNGSETLRFNIYYFLE